MTVRDFLSVANQNTGLQIWEPDNITPRLDIVWNILESESYILDREVAEFEVRPISSDYADLVITVMGEKENA